MNPQRARTDRNNNPIACTTAVAREAGLVEGVDFLIGDSFTVGSMILYTAKFVKDPITTSIEVIDKGTYYTHLGGPRWTYIAIPKFIWDTLNQPQKKQVIAFHYQHEGGSEMKGLFA